MANRRKRKVAVAQRPNNDKPKRKAPRTAFKPGNEYRLKPGFDPRRNLNGAPRTHKELEDLIQAIGAEQIDGTNWTRIEAKIRQWFTSQKPQDSQNVIEHGWGKVKDESEHSGQLKIIVEYADHQVDASETPSSAAAGEERSEAI